MEIRIGKRKILTIKQEIDIAAIGTLIIGLITSLNTYFIFFAKPKVILIPPENILVSSYSAIGTEYVAFNASLIYSYFGEKGTSIVILRERLYLKLSDSIYQFRGDKHVISGVKGGALVMKTLSTFTPILIKPGSSIAHETIFHPEVLECPPGNDDCYNRNKGRNHIKYDDFVKEVVEKKQFSIELSYELYGGDSASIECQVHLREFELNTLMERQWSVLRCWDTSEIEGNS